MSYIVSANRHTTATCLVAAALTGCTPVAPCDGTTSLQQQAPFPVGVAVGAPSDDAMSLASAQFDRITPENAMKMESTHPVADTLDFSLADAWLAETAGGFTDAPSVHGHTLIWHSQTAPWLDDFVGDRAAWLDIMERYVLTVVSEYRGRVVGWDVVNEAFTDDGELRDSPWRAGIGDDYLDWAFIFAADADPDAVLFLNDYNLWRHGAKRRATLEWIEGALERGVPVHGIGFQGHIDLDAPGARAIRRSLRQASETGLQVHISELDIRVNRAESVDADLEATFDEQAMRYRHVVQAYTEQVPASQQYGITLWGLHDGVSWIPGYTGFPDAPLLWDDSLDHKPAFCGFVEGLD